MTCKRIIKYKPQLWAYMEPSQPIEEEPYEEQHHIGERCKRKQKNACYTNTFYISEGGYTVAATTTDATKQSSKLHLDYCTEG